MRFVDVDIRKRYRNPARNKIYLRQWIYPYENSYMDLSAELGVPLSKLEIFDNLHSHLAANYPTLYRTSRIRIIRFPIVSPAKKIHCISAARRFLFLLFRSSVLSRAKTRTDPLRRARAPVTARDRLSATVKPTARRPRTTTTTTTTSPFLNAALSGR